MGTGRKGRRVAEMYHDMADIGPRVGAWLRQAYPNSVAKNAARQLGVSERQAKRWAAGERPTSEHLTTMARLWGWRFVHFVYEGVLPPPTNEIHDRLDRIERQLAAIGRTSTGEGDE